MRWLVTGADGMLGRDLAVRLRPEYDLVAAGRASLDVTDARGVRAAVRDVDVVVNCAAWTDVDGAESHEAAAAAVNAVGPGLLAQACRESGTWLVHLSTDYVFAGDADEPYDEHARLAPLSAYGRTKAAGETAVRHELPAAHHVVRTAWLYGAHGRCFPTTIARAARDRGSVRVVDDQLGQPTWTVDVADLAVRLVETGAPAGTYHATSSGSTSWWGFACEVVAAAGLDPAVVERATSAEFVRPAPRPAYSVLGHAALERVGLAPIGDWRERWRAAARDVLGS